MIENINKNNDKFWLKHRIEKICNLVDNKEINLNLLKLSDDTFKRNLDSIDNHLCILLSYILLDYYSHTKLSNLSNLVVRLSDKNPLNISENGIEYYGNIIKSFLENITFGMIPSEEWDNNIINDGLLVVKKDGSLVNLHRFHNGISLKNYLFENTKLETPSTSRYNIGYLVKTSLKDKYYLCLNLQIRMK